MSCSASKPSLPNGRSHRFVNDLSVFLLNIRKPFIDQASAQSPWVSVNGAQLTVIAETVPVSSALPNALSVVIPSNASSNVGVANPGYFGEHPGPFKFFWLLLILIDRHQSEF